jgi:CheY-like chemotaxis protein
MDFNMPGMNGADCTKILKSKTYRDSIGNAVFIALTAQDDKLVKDAFRDAGVTQFIFKPYTYAIIKEHLIKNNIIRDEPDN